MSETTEIVLKVDGKAVGKARPRFNTKTGRTYTEGKTKMAERRIQAMWAAEGRPRLPHGPIVFTVEMAVERPRNHYKVNGELSAAGLRAKWPVRKPDLDNALKTFADALNGLAYRDDMDIVHAWIVRRWCRRDEHEHTLIRMRPAPEPLVERQAA